QLSQMFQQDEIYATVTGRYNWPSLKKLGLPLGFAAPEEGVTGGMNVLVLIKGPKNKDLALRFIDAWLGEEAQTKIAIDRADSPVNMNVKLPPDVADEMTYGEATAKSLKLIPPAEAVANRGKWLDAWNNKIAR